MEGQINSAMRFLNDDISGGVLPLTDDIMLQLREKHHGGWLLCNLLPLRFQLRNLYLVSCEAYMTRLQLTHVKWPLFSLFFTNRRS